jgi:NADP-dependent 3-hydroxy acid dehydrogenase YdfG
MSAPLQDRVALITGGGTGIGAATAKELAASGVSVAIMGRRDGPLVAVCDSIRANGGRCIAIPGDVRNYSEVESAAQRTLDEFRGLDILVANAALVDHGPIDQADPAFWGDLIATNVLGVMYAVRASLPRMYERGSGDVVIVASVSGRTTYVGEPAYIASKHATVAFADCLRKEAGGRGIRVIVLEPGLVDTPFIDWPAVRQLLPDVEPLQPDDCARVIRFALEQPMRSALNEIVIRPAGQAF